MTDVTERPGWATDEGILVELDGLRWVILDAGEATSVSALRAAPLTVRLTGIFDRDSLPDSYDVTTCRVGHVQVRVEDKVGRGAWVHLGMRELERLDDGRVTCRLRRAAKAPHDGAEAEAPVPAVAVHSPAVERPALLHSTTFVWENGTRLVTLDGALAEPPVSVKRIEVGRGQVVVDVTHADGESHEVASLADFVEFYDLDLDALSPAALDALARVFDVQWRPTHVVTLRRAERVRRFVVACKPAHVEHDGPHGAYTLAEWALSPSWAADDPPIARWRVSSWHDAMQAGAWSLAKGGARTEHVDPWTLGWTLDVEEIARP